jgi:hypothetical protein
MIDLDLRHHTLSTTGNRALERRSIIQPLLSYLEVKMSDKDINIPPDFRHTVQIRDPRQLLIKNQLRVVYIKLPLAQPLRASFFSLDDPLRLVHFEDLGD